MGTNFKMFFNRRWVSCLVLFCFAFMLSAAPATAPTGRDASASKDRSGVAENDSPGLIEQNQPVYAPKKKSSILPYILIGVGVVGIAAVLYFLVLKKEQLKEDFTSKASKNWIPRVPADWSVSGGSYKCSTVCPYWHYNIYDKEWSKTNYTVTVRLMLEQSSGAKGVILATGKTPTSISGYLFDMSTSSNSYSFHRYDSRDMVNGSGTITTLQSWKTSSAIHSGAGAWNVIKAVRAGSTYQYYANDVLLQTFTDVTYDPRYIILAFQVYESQTDISFDYVYVDMGASTIAGAAAAPVLFNNFQPGGDDRDIPIRIR